MTAPQPSANKLPSAVLSYGHNASLKLKGFWIFLLILQSNAAFWMAKPSPTTHRCFSSSLTLYSVSNSATDGRVSGVTLKIALDAMGGVADMSANNTSERFTSEKSLDAVHRLRCVSDAVLVGRATVESDNPSLTVRRVPCDNQPLRVVLDPKLSLTQKPAVFGYTLFQDGLPTVIFHTVNDADDSLLDLNETVTSVSLPSLKLSAVLDRLTRRFGVNHVMVEGGPVTARAFLQEKLVDRALLVKAPLCFRKPLPSGLDNSVMETAGLLKLGSYPSGDDEVECWSRPSLPWPTQDLSDWP